MVDSNTPDRDILIGFDPSWITMGVARYVPATGHLTLYTSDFDSVIKWVCESTDLNRAVAVVENPALDSVSFNAWQKCKWAITQVMRGKMNFEDMATIVRSQFKSSRNVGENQAAGKYLIKKLHDSGVPVFEVAPSSRKKAYKETTIKGKTIKTLRKLSAIPYATKSTAVQFEDWCGFPAKRGNNEHSRDAATLVVYRTVSDVIADIVRMKADRIAAAEKKAREKDFKKRLKSKSK